MNMTDITIYHNPACGTSRNTLALIRNSGAEPDVIEYLKTPPGKEKLQELLAAMGIPARELLRQKGTPYEELGLGDPKWTEDELVDFMVQHPILMNRPVVLYALGCKALPSQRAGAGHFARRTERRLHQRRWRSGGQRTRPAYLTTQHA
jgi:arsenate reductase